VANNNPTTKALKQYNKDKSIKAKAKIKQALEKMLQNSEEVNIQKLSQASGISRTTIYKDQEIRDTIDRFRETSVLRKNRKVKYEKELALERASSSKLRVLTEKLREERVVIEKLKNENLALKQHIEKITQEANKISRIKPI
jgi:hypothetical protein